MPETPMEVGAGVPLDLGDSDSDSDLETDFDKLEKAKKREREKHEEEPATDPLNKKPKVSPDHEAEDAAVDPIPKAPVVDPPEGGAEEDVMKMSKHPAITNVRSDEMFWATGYNNQKRVRWPCIVIQDKSVLSSTDQDFLEGLMTDDPGHMVLFLDPHKSFFVVLPSDNDFRRFPFVPEDDNYKTFIKQFAKTAKGKPKSWRTLKSAFPKTLKLARAAYDRAVSSEEEKRKIEESRLRQKHEEREVVLAAQQEADQRRAKIRFEEVYDQALLKLEPGDRIRVRIQSRIEEAAIVSIDPASKVPVTVDSLLAGIGSGLSAEASSRKYKIQRVLPRELVAELGLWVPGDPAFATDRKSSNGEAARGDEESNGAGSEEARDAAGKPPGGREPAKADKAEVGLVKTDEGEVAKGKGPEATEGVDVKAAGDSAFEEKAASETGGPAKAEGEGGTAMVAKEAAEGDTAKVGAEGDTTMAEAEDNMDKKATEGDTVMAETEGSTAKEAAEGDVAKKAAEGDVAMKATEGDAAKKAAEGDVAKKAAEGDVAKTAAEGDSANEVAKDPLHGDQSSTDPTAKQREIFVYTTGFYALDRFELVEGKADASKAQTVEEKFTDGFTSLKKELEAKDPSAAEFIAFKGKTS